MDEKCEPITARVGGASFCSPRKKKILFVYHVIFFCRPAEKLILTAHAQSKDEKVQAS